MENILVMQMIIVFKEKKMKIINLDRVSDIQTFWDVAGFDKKEFISIIGRTGSGKTALSIALACLAYGKHNKKVLFIGSEDCREQFDKYLLRYHCDREREENDWVTIQVANNDITFEEIKEYSREYQSDLIVIDSYVAYKGFDDIMDFATKLKSFVNTEDKTIIVTTQLNRVEDCNEMEGNYLSFVSDTVLFCSLQDKSIHAETIKSRQTRKDVFELEY